MKNILLFLLFTNIAFAQKSFFVKDAATNEPIAYTTVFTEKGAFKVNAELDGSFIIPNELLNEVFIFDAVGYELKRQALTDVILLEPKSELLDEVVIVPRLGTKEIKVGKIDKKKIKLGVYDYTQNVAPLLASKFSISNDELRFIKEIRVKIYSEKDYTKFALKVYSSGENGEPYELLNDEPIYCDVNKGYTVSKIDLTDFNIKIGSNYFFVAVENLNIKNNVFQVEKGGKIIKFFSPSICMNKSENNTSWYGHLVEGKIKWIQQRYDDEFIKENKGYLNFQIEVTLTN